MIVKYKVAYSDKLLALTHDYDECDTIMSATGKMYYDLHWGKWFIEYLCPDDPDPFRIWSANRDALTRKIAQDFVLEDLPTVY